MPVGTKALQYIKYKSLMADWCSDGFTLNPRIDLRMHTSLTELRILSLVYLAWKILERMFMNHIPLYSEKPRKMNYVCSNLFNQIWGFLFSFYGPYSSNHLIINIANLANVLINFHLHGAYKHYVYLKLFLKKNQKETILIY